MTLLSDSLEDSTAEPTSSNCFHKAYARICRDTDRLFIWLMLFQWIGGIVTAFVISPRTWIGNTPHIHLHVWIAFLLGGLLSSLPIILALYYPSRPLTRHVIAVSQMLWSGLLIHLSGGRIETHFHVFGSLAFLAFYRDWRVLISATIVIATDHFIRGVWWPLSVFGVFVEDPYRWIEHAAWVIFEDIFLIRSSIKGFHELQKLCQRQEKLQKVNMVIENEVKERTSELHKTNIQMKDEINQRIQSEQRLRAIFANTLDPILLVNKSGIIFEASHSVKKVLGWDVDELLGQNINIIVPEPAASSHDDYLRQFFLTRKSSIIGEMREMEAVKKDGSILSCELMVWMSEIVHNGEIQFTAQIRDISSRKNKEKELEVARAEKFHNEKLASIGQLASGIAHEINTPIQFIGDNVRASSDMFTDLKQLVGEYRSLVQELQQENSFSESIAIIRKLEDELDTDYIFEDAPKAFSQSLDGVERVRIIVQAMKEFSHCNKSAEKVSFDLNASLTSTITVARNEWKYIAEVKTQFADLPKIEGFPDELNQVFLNILVNAAHAIEEKEKLECGLISIKTRLEHKWVVVSFSDNGCGIPESIQNKIFNPFFTTKEIGRGTGQGLAISFRVIAERHGGKIELETEEGVGTTFHIWLPIKSGADTALKNEKESSVS